MRIGGSTLPPQHFHGRAILADLADTGSDRPRSTEDGPGRVRPADETEAHQPGLGRGRLGWWCVGPDTS